jgi:predicted phosphodiesterase
MFGDMMKKNYITTIILLTVLMLTACDKVSPTGVLIASSDVDDRVKMSHEYYQIHKREYNVLVGRNGEYTFLVGADSHMTNDPGRMKEMLDNGIDNNDLFIAHLGDIADTKAEYYINLDSVVQKARDKYIKKNYHEVVVKDDKDIEHVFYREPHSTELYTLDQLKMPFYPVVGNHDLTNNGWALWTNIFNSSFYTVFIYVGDEEGHPIYDHLIFLDTASGTLGREQIDLLDDGALDDMFKVNPDGKLRHTFVFGHTNIFRVGTFELASTFPREETYYLLNKFDEWDADIVFCGHVHQWDEQHIGDVTYLTLDSMSERNNPGPGNYLVRVHVKTDGSLSWERVRMNYTPNR